MILFHYESVTFGQVIPVDGSFDYAYVTRGIHHFEDSTGSVEMPEIIAKDFNEIKTNAINLGFSKSTYWFRFLLINEEQQPGSVYLDIRNHYLEYIDIYEVSEKNKVIAHYPTGSKRNKVVHQKINLEADQTKTIYLKIKSRTPIRVPLFVRSEQNQQKSIGSTRLFLGIFYGVCLLLLLANLYLWIASKDKLFLYFLLTLVSLVIFNIGFDNLLPEIIWFETPDFFWLRLTTFIPLVALFYILFSEKFFELKNKHRFIKASLHVLKVIALLNFIIFNLHYYTGNKIGFFVTTFVGLYLTVISFYLFISFKYKHLRFYLIANLLFTTSVVLHVLSNMGVVPGFILSMYSIKAGYILQITVFAIAVADKYLMFQKNFTNLLQEKVEERTTELEQALNQLKIRQQQLIQSEKMASLGTLVSGVAHEINNPLNFITGGLHVLEELKDETGKGNKETKEIDTAYHFISSGIKRIARIVNALMTFSQGDSSIKKKVNINNLIDSTIVVMESRIPEQVKISKSYHLDTEIPVIQDKLHLVILAILDNALYSLAKQSFENQPSIQIKTGVINLDKKMALIEITNNGPKIPDAIIHHIFDPFFTTKAPGEGTGLGLSEAYNIIVNDHGGYIQAKNSKEDVIFEIGLPLT